MNEGPGSRQSFEDPSWGARNAVGWEMCLDNLELFLRGAVLAKFAVEVWQRKFAHYVEKFEPQVGPQQGMPENHPAASEQAAPGDAGAKGRG